tara:strand:- start:336 stop:470 length:135 start_codon:yes stop_codon:yes gene_type:complete
MVMLNVKLVKKDIMSAESVVGILSNIVIIVSKGGLTVELAMTEL